MNEMDLVNGITVRTFGFNVPCRQFIVSAQVTRDKRMPMVDEFVLRALKMCGDISVTRLAGYFGFSKSEMQTVLVDLGARSLIVASDNTVALHPSAMEMFRTSGDGAPTIMEVEEWVEWLWFDLISQNMIASQGLRRGRNLVEMKPSVSRRNLPEDFAREAFQSNFRDYLKTVRRINNPENLSLYAITDVQPGRFGFVPISGKEDLLFDPLPKLKPTLFELEEERPQRLRLLTDAMLHAYQELTEPDPSIASRTEYGRLTDTSSIADTTDSNGFVDVRQWIEKEMTLRTVDVQGFVGSIYVERNRRSFCAMLGNAIGGRDVDESKALELVWFRPGGSAWGASDDLRLMLGDLRATLRKISSVDGTFVSSLVIPASMRNDKPKRFDRIFDRAFVASSGFLSPALEILFIRGIGAVISVNIPLSDKTSVWIGRITIKPSDLARIEQRLGWLELESKLERIWNRATEDSEI